MPRILDRLVSQLKAKGKSESQAFAIATKALQKSGNLKPGSTEPTRKGVVRGNMTPAERAKDRQSKRSGHPPSAYKYNSSTNLATLKGKPGYKKKR